MVKSITSIKIARPVAEVFGFFQHVENYPLWQEVTPAVSVTNGLNKGSRITCRGPEGLHTIITVIENNGRDLMRSEVVSGKYRMRTSYQLSADGSGGTQLTAVIEGQVLSLPLEAETALQYQADARSQANLSRLKAVLEKKDVATGS